jgi:ABC-type multidrug transport system fused ATPase/permease subunit
MLGFLPT